MTDAKSSINTLCKHLNLLYNLNLKPETFRLAKFDKNENNTVPILWNVLSKLCLQPNVTNIVKNVKLHLLREKKYENYEFFALSESMTSGSREILLAIGYLIATGSLHNAVNKEIRNSPFNTKIKKQQQKEANGNFNINLNNIEMLKEKDYNNFVKWMEGKLSYLKKQAEDFKEESEKIKHKVIETLPCIKDNYSIEELLALKQSEHSEAYLNNTERVMNIILNHEKWLKCESIFWEWMESVIGEKEKCKGEINADDLKSFIAFAQNN